MDNNILFSPTSRYVPHGLGRLFYSGITGSYILEGTFFEGKPFGYCRWIWDDGMYYVGHMKGFKCHGRGKKILGNSQKDVCYDGEWKNGKMIEGEIKQDNFEINNL